MTKKILTAFIALGLVFTAVSCSDDGGKESTNRVTFNYDEDHNRYSGYVTEWDGAPFYFKFDYSYEEWEFGTLNESNPNYEAQLATGNFENLSETTLKLNREKVSYELIDSPKSGWKTITINNNNSFTVTFTDSDWHEIYPGLN